MEQPVFSITRSFSKKVQIKQYEPEDFFCSMTKMFYSMPSLEEIQFESLNLYRLCEQEVMRSLAERLDSFKKEVEGEDAPY